MSLGLFTLRAPEHRQSYVPILGGPARSWRAHDLLWLRPLTLDSAASLPAWLLSGWLRTAPVVVRREHVAHPDYVAVGVRGWARSQRLAAYVPSQAAIRCVTPESLVRPAAWCWQPGLRRFAAVRALAGLASALEGLGLAWGPVGGVGFALASGWPVLHVGSDLDLLIRAHRQFTDAQANMMRAAFASAGCRVDAQIDTGAGGFAFTEWASGAKRVLLRTATGPVLTSDPWEAAQPVASPCPTC